jgi:hypothetical protein
MTEQDKGNLLIQVTAWAGLTVCVWERTNTDLIGTYLDSSVPNMCCSIQI